MLRATAVLLLGLLTLPAFGQKKPLDHSVYDGWQRIEGEAIADDGRWALWHQVPQEGDATLHVRSLDSMTEHTVARGDGARFTHDGRYVVFTIKPEHAAVKQAKHDKTKPADMPKDSLGVLDLVSGEITRVPRVTSVALPEEAGGWVAYRTEAMPAEKADEARDTTATSEEEAHKPKKGKQDGTPLVLHRLADGATWTFAHATDYAFTDDGAHLIYIASTKADGGDGVFAVATATGVAQPLMEGEGDYKQLVLADGQAAFVSNRDAYAADAPAFTLYHARLADGHAEALATSGHAALRAGWGVSEHESLSFSDDGTRLFFGTAPNPTPEPETLPDDERVDLDVWHWQDPYLQPMQLLQADSERKRAYLAVAHLADDRIVQLATPSMPEVTVGADGDADVALATSSLPYRQMISWDTPGKRDAYLIDVATGAARPVVEGTRGNPRFSPQARFVYWYDPVEEGWMTYDVATGSTLTASADVPHRLSDEMDDRPMLDGTYGAAGWTANDQAFVVYDAYDLWTLDPSATDGYTPARSLTEERGRATATRFRYVDLDPDTDHVPETLLLSGFDTATKADGFYRDTVGGTRTPQRLVQDDLAFGRPLKAADADRMLVTQETYRRFPDLYLTGPDFAAFSRLSDANPQQADYAWGSVELVAYRNVHGQPMQGLLYKPEGFDPNGSYPMMVYFYERYADRLHAYSPPEPHRTIINFPFYVSRGYVLFVPDIAYEEGYPGKSAMDNVIPGVMEILEDGYVDPARVGVQGHSWGGYQIAYMITQTDLFAAAEAGAPVSNMTSAYGGIRWASGMSRMFQYEQTQSRIGGTLWEYPMRYLDNSPLFYADRVNTPLLMMHNDNDGAVPWYQGIEYFVALRRLGKPVWMLNYNGEGHWIMKRAGRKDWAIRMQQFFDHYLMGAPAPVWMTEGVPAVDKGRTLGLEVEAAVPETGGSH